MRAPREYAGLVAVTLASAIALALLLLTGITMYSVIFTDDPEPARLVAITQVLTGWGGGMSRHLRRVHRLQLR